MKKTFYFEKIAQDSRTHARAGVIHTPHGDIETPAFVPVGTQATVKSLTPEDLKSIGTQLYFVNTYHMYLRPGMDVIRSFGGLHAFMHWDRPLITDSGGFQVFSLARKQSLVKISEESVEFQSHWDGSKHIFTPESSMDWQAAMGSDIHIAFDDCTPYPVTHELAEASMERTHRWAKRSLNAHTQGSLYGSIQGSVYEDLRIQSAKFITSLPFDGFAIGGVSVGESKKEMSEVLNWVMPLLPDDKPRHLLGVGEIDDLFTLIEAGVDTFDCVQPTRLARMGWLLVPNSLALGSAKNIIDITKSVYSLDKQAINPDCICYTCQNFTRCYLQHLFHVKELLGYRLATIHNLSVMHELTKAIRAAIRQDSFLELKRQWL